MSVKRPSFSSVIASNFLINSAIPDSNSNPPMGTIEPVDLMYGFVGLNVAIFEILMLEGYTTEEVYTAIADTPDLVIPEINVMFNPTANDIDANAVRYLIDTHSNEDVIIDMIKVIYHVYMVEGISRLERMLYLQNVVLTDMYNQGVFDKG